jgi:hypothetical protein
MIKVLPDLLKLNDGTSVTKAVWERRRSELYKSIVPHEYGGLPPSGEETIATRICESRMWKDGGARFQSYDVRVHFSGGRELSFLLNLWIPATEEGPFPVILDGDGCWRYFNDAIVRRILSRGYIAASFNRTQVAADDPDIYRSTGIYRLFPDGLFGAISAWAWGYHRCVDVLQEHEFVKADSIAITGHSRGGKTVFLAGATDERIALTNPNNSGVAGSGLNRLKCKGAEVIDDFYGSRNIFWFGDEFKAFRDRDGELPYDQHYFHALVAPRGLLATEAYEDREANPPGSYAACLTAQKVFDLLGAPKKIGWAFREGGHEHREVDYDALLDFADLHFRGGDAGRDFQRPLYPHLSEILK